MTILTGGERNRNISEADVAHAILKAKGAPIYFRDLFEEVMTLKPVNGKDKVHIMAGIHTDLNLDTRFVHMGNGVWGLREWTPERRSYVYQPEEELEI
ncbi:MAG: DNA-directed RNA polymerase subunit delta [Firmicutes bacterium HGW-Firmicutes-14]|jgi:DNA-directed RNA polymerase subunit delta|nr:MAG: DNA-directed RNA polymerase subunit delta [Firmicutes bacterium HGW-Firmicutes-14]